MQCKKEIFIYKKKKKEYFELFRDHKHVIRSCPNEKQRDLQQLQMSFFHGRKDNFLSNHLFDLFPCRLNSRIGNSSMQAIQEENRVNDEQQDYRATPIKRTQQRGKNKL